MEDEILDYNWVISKEIPIKETEGTLFQQYFNEESLILAATMLYDNRIKYHIKVDNPEENIIENLVHEIHINEEDLERAHELLELLQNKDQKYPIKKYWNYSLHSLEMLLEENENVYVDTLVRMELTRRGINLEDDSNFPEEENSSFMINILIFLSGAILLYIFIQFILEII